WTDSISSNIASARAASQGKDFGEQLHAMDYLVHAYLQEAQDQKAQAIIADMNAVSGVNPNVFVGPYALAVSPARYVLERGDWKEGAELPVRPSKFAYADAVTYFARALGAARGGNPAAAMAEIAKVTELREKLRDAKDVYWTEQVDIQAQIAGAWTLYA